MSYDPRLAGGPRARPERDGNAGGKPAGGGGSVRAARERLQQAQMQGQLPDRSRIVGLPQRPNQLVSQYSVQNQPQQAQPRYQQQQYLTPPNSRGGIPPASPPSPQWPLSNDAEDSDDSPPAQFPRPPNRGPPPQRPPRPVSEEFPIQQTALSPSDYRGSADYRSSYQSDDFLSPTEVNSTSRPLTTSSAASTNSSLGDIPDFPVPQPPMPTIQGAPRRNANLGPPPSARRGPSSYYTQMSYVSPIAEESETRSDTIRSHHGSFASSMVIPANNEDFYLEDEGIRSEDDETITGSDFGRESQASDHDEQSGLVQQAQPALVRQASLGRRTKPSLMTIKSDNSLKNGDSTSTKRKGLPNEARSSAAAGAIPDAMLAASQGISSRGSPGAAASLRSGTGLLDASSSSSDSLDSLRKERAGLGPAQTRGLDPEKNGLESAAYALQQPTRPAQASTLADRIGKRRPPRIDVDAVREAEARGSLTSLPELIRRATRLAANLDRGKTASRLGFDFWEAGAPEKNNKFDSRRSGSLSDMLAAFPPPGDATPRGDLTPIPDNRRLSKWPSSGAMGGPDAASKKEKGKGRRKCCGIPMWTFITLLIVLLFLIAAAVVIPVVLIAIPKMKENQNNAAAQTSTSGSSASNSNNNPATTSPASGSDSDKCTGIITCQNGGVAVPQTDTTCNCVCINGFTGKTCATATDAGCTTTNVAGTANNATVGASIPRLFESAESNFSVPLQPSSLLAIFSNLSLSCTSENALITFNGVSSRSVPEESQSLLPLLVDKSLEPSRSLPVLEQPHYDREPRKLDQRQTVGEVPDRKGAASASATGAKAAATATTQQPISSNTTAIDYARMGVLLVLQETRTFDSAANAQEAVQTFLSNDRSGSGNSGTTVNMGSGITMDLSAFTIKLSNGTVISATSTSTNSTKSS